jgi:hypothetical protein
MGADVWAKAASAAWMSSAAEIAAIEIEVRIDPPRIETLQADFFMPLSAKLADGVGAVFRCRLLCD